MSKKDKTLPADKVCYEDVYFTVSACSKMTEAAFIEHEKHHGLTPAQLKEAYKLIKEAAAPAKDTTAK